MILGALAVRGLGRRPSNPDAELLRRAQAPAASLALDREGGAEARPAARALRTELAAALGAVRRQLVDEVLEVALHEPAGEAKRDPVAQRLAALFP